MTIRNIDPELDMTADGLDLVMNTGMSNTTNLEIKSPYCQFQQSQDKDLPGTSAGQGNANNSPTGKKGETKP